MHALNWHPGQRGIYKAFKNCESNMGFVAVGPQSLYISKLLSVRLLIGNTFHWFEPLDRSPDDESCSLRLVATLNINCTCQYPKFGPCSECSCCKDLVETKALAAKLSPNMQAIAALQKAHSADPTNAEVLLSLGVSYTNELDQRHALDFLMAWLRTIPGQQAAASVPLPNNARERLRAVTDIFKSATRMASFLITFNASTCCHHILSPARLRKVHKYFCQYASRQDSVVDCLHFLLIQFITISGAL